MKARLQQSSINWMFLITTLVLGGLGLINLHSTSQSTTTNLVLVQGIWFAVGFLIIFVLTIMDYQVFERMAFPILGVTLVVLLLVLVVGREIKGSRRWLQFGAFNFQPSEMAKIAVILGLAKYFSDEPKWPSNGFTLRALIKPQSILYPIGCLGALSLFWEELPQGWWLFAAAGIFLFLVAASFLYMVRTGNTSLHSMINPVILVIAPAVLILRQPDLGTTLVLFAIAGTMILFIRIRTVSLILASIALVGMVVVSWNYVLKPYQKERISAFLEPSQDLRGTGYHARQSMIAVGSGGVSGKGYMESTQTQFKFLPEQHTDFVFSVWAEEWGFWGSLGVLVLFLFWFIQMINIASSARDRFGIMVAVGITSMFFWHWLVNIGMVIGLMPVVGVTLPLWSYGGSSLLISMAGVGLLISIAVRRYRLS